KKEELEKRRESLADEQEPREDDQDKDGGSGDEMRGNPGASTGAPEKPQKAWNNQDHGALGEKAEPEEKIGQEDGGRASPPPLRRQAEPVGEGLNGRRDPQGKEHVDRDDGGEEEEHRTCREHEPRASPKAPSPQSSS